MPKQIKQPLSGRGHLTHKGIGSKRGLSNDVIVEVRYESQAQNFRCYLDIPEWEIWGLFLDWYRLLPVDLRKEWLDANIDEFVINK